MILNDLIPSFLGNKVAVVHRNTNNSCHYRANITRREVELFCFFLEACVTGCTVANLIGWKWQINQQPPTSIIAEVVMTFVVRGKHLTLFLLSTCSSFKWSFGWIEYTTGKGLFEGSGCKLVLAIFRPVWSNLDLLFYFEKMLWCLLFMRTNHLHYSSSSGASSPTIKCLRKGTLSIDGHATSCCPITIGRRSLWWESHHCLGLQPMRGYLLFAKLCIPSLPLSC